MTDDTITLELSGSVSIDDLAHAARSLHNLLSELSRSVADDAHITWLVDSLEASSAITVYRGVSSNGTRPEQIADVVRAYGAVGRSLERGEPVVYPRAALYANQLVELIGDRVSGLRFETAEVDALISGSEKMGRHRTAATSVQPRDQAYGAVEGRIQTLSNRGGLRFTLYDTLFDRAVACYLPADFDVDSLRDKWGRKAIVEGIVKRDPVSGRPLNIRQVSDVIPRPESDQRDYMQSRGVLSPGGTDVTTLVRQSRDG